MRRLRLLACLLTSAGSTLCAQEFLDSLGQRLTFSAFDDNVRARVSGTLDLEFYAFQQPPPGLIDSEDNVLFNPRLILFLDTQIGAPFYIFAQARFDRAFDPRDIPGAQARLDEYALRFTPTPEGQLSLQIGKFATVVGNWVARHLSWDNPFINAPLAYENVTPLEDAVAPSTYYLYDGELHDEKYEYLPLIWGPSYATGISVAGKLWKFEYAAEVKNASLSSRPEVWDANRRDFRDPTVSARLGFRPNEMWNFGASASDGAYLRREVAPTLPFGRRVDEFHETVIAQDISFAWHHLQIWAEFFEGRFDAPRLGYCDTFTYYIEAKYKFTPQLFGALRWGQQFFSDVPDGLGGEIPWSRDISRLEAAATYRFTEHIQAKLQYLIQHEEDARRDLSHMLAAQLTVRF